MPTGRSSGPMVGGCGAVRRGGAAGLRLMSNLLLLFEYVTKIIIACCTHLMRGGFA